LPAEAFEVPKMGDMPQVLVVTFQLPSEPPSLFKSKDDGQGSEVTFFLKPSKRLRDQLAGTVIMSNAAKLLCRWCATADSDKVIRKRFKCMALVDHLEKLNMGWLKSYNGRPILITESGKARKSIVDDVSVLEMNSNVHAWNFIAKKGFVSLLPNFKKMRLNIGFTIEAHGDDEMPECILGSVTMNYIDETILPTISPEMQKIDYNVV